MSQLVLIKMCLNINGNVYFSIILGNLIRLTRIIVSYFITILLQLPFPPFFILFSVTQFKLFMALTEGYF